MSIDYVALRDDLADLVGKMPGVISVGLGKQDDEYVLVIAINDKFEEAEKAHIPVPFHGVNVVFNNIGDIKLYSVWEIDNESEY